MRRWPIQYHFVGKDITRFHCVIWPAMLMAAGMPITHTVFGHGFLLTKGEKMSKSKGNGLMPADLVRVFGVDAYRYYFMSDVQFGHDGSISHGAHGAGVQRRSWPTPGATSSPACTNMTTKYFEGRVPEACPPGSENNPLRRDRRRAVCGIRRLHGRGGLHRGRGGRAEAGGAA